MGAVNYWSKRLNHGQGPLWLQSGGQQQRETEGWKIVFTIWGPGEREGEAERRKGEQRQTERPNWWPEPKGLGVHMEGNTLPCALLHTLLF